jgi:hypothetical protein
MRGMRKLRKLFFLDIFKNFVPLFFLNERKYFVREENIILQFLQLVTQFRSKNTVRGQILRSFWDEK